MRAITKATALAVATFTVLAGMAVGATTARAELTDPDLGFGTAGVVQEARALGAVNVTRSATDAQGRLVIAVLDVGAQTRVRVFRYTADGSPDATFGSGGETDLPGTTWYELSDLVIQGNGRILVSAMAGPPSGPAIFGLTSAGALDATWGTAGISTGFSRKMVVMSDDRVLLLDSGLSLQLEVRRLTAAGIPDDTFGTAGVVELPGLGSPVITAHAQGTGALVLLPGGQFGFPPATVIRLSASGAIDPGFGSGGSVSVGAAVDLLIEPSGSFLITTAPNDIAVTRWSAGGVQQAGIGAGGVVSTVAISALDPNGRLVTASGYGPGLTMTRLLPSLAPDQSFGTPLQGGGFGTIYGTRVDLVSTVDEAPVALSSDGKGRTVVAVVAGGKLYVARLLTAPSGQKDNPFGSFDALTSGPGGLTMTGWAIDPDTSAPATIHVYVDGQYATQVVASGSRPDVGAAFAYGDAHGFGSTMAVGPGAHTVCAFAINVGPGTTNPLLGCRSITRVSNPIGSLDAVNRIPGALLVRGWALDPDSTGAVTVHVYVDGQFWGLAAANGARPDVGAFFAGYGPDHGYGITGSVAPGRHTVCVYAINQSFGTTNPQLGCQVVDVSGAPIGSLESVTRAPGGFTVAGWALDPDAAGPISVHLTVDGSIAPVTADQPRADVGAVLPLWGPNHGYAARFNAYPGTHTVCAYGISVGGGPNSLLGCRTFVVDGTPFGSWDGAVRTPSGVRLTGWAIDPDTDQPVQVVFRTSGASPIGPMADTSRPDVAAAYPGWSANHGFDVVVPWASGSLVCAEIMDSGVAPLTTRSLGCRTIP